MILRWKTVGPMEQKALWQGRSLSLTYTQDQQSWRLTVDGLKVRQRFSSPRAAMTHVETVLNRIILARATVAQAQQRPRTAMAVQRGQ